MEQLRKTKLTPSLGTFKQKISMKVRFWILFLCLVTPFNFKILYVYCKIDLSPYLLDQTNKD